MTQDVERAADVLLADGGIASIRPLRVDDREGLMLLHDHVGDDNIRLRYFATGREAGRRYVEHLLSHSGDTVATLVAPSSAAAP